MGKPRDITDKLQSLRITSFSRGSFAIPELTINSASQIYRYFLKKCVILKKLLNMVEKLLAENARIYQNYSVQLNG